MKRFCTAVCVLVLVLIAPTFGGQKIQEPDKSHVPKTAAQDPALKDYSQEPFVIERYYTTARFENDGTNHRDLTVRIRVQTDSGVQQLGELVFGYNSGNEQMEVRRVRVLKPDGTLILGTPDYATVGWNIIEPLYGLLIPGGYHDEHITHYTRQSLTDVLVRNGFVHEDTAYIARSELIMRFRNTGVVTVAAGPPAASPEPCWASCA